MPKLSIIVPVFNEAKTIRSVLEKLLSLPLDKEIIVVDDGSTDGTGKIIDIFIPAVRVIRHKVNSGKGMALRDGIAAATGDYIIFCDADLEYDINQIPLLYKYLRDNRLAVLYGSRFINYRPKKNFIHYLGNKILTLATNWLFGAKLTDMETGYKLFRADILKNLDLASSHFEIEPEITAKTLKQGIPIVELPISYDPRVKSEGKKIKYRDGLMALKTLIKEKLKRRG
jgi:glycosyltransferase involved in cell wall biosynthesis